MVRISPDTSGRIRVIFPYNPELVARLRMVETRKWHPNGKYWSFENSKPILNEILSILAAGELDIDPSLGVSVPRKSFPIEPLLERARHLIRLKHYSIRTEQSYLPWIQRYIVFHNSRDPMEMASQEVESFLSHLAVNLKVSASTQNQAFNALLFLYREVLNKKLEESINAIRAKKPQYLPTVKTLGEKCPDCGKIVDYGRLGEAALLSEESGETSFDRMEGATLNGSTRDNASIAQIPEQVA
jgi:hypothetical protein